MTLKNFFAFVCVLCSDSFKWYVAKPQSDIPLAFIEGGDGTLCSKPALDILLICLNYSPSPLFLILHVTAEISSGCG